MAYRDHSQERVYISKEEYEEYLTTPEWRQLVKQRTDIDKGHCQFCGRSGRLQCHHITYYHIKSENVFTDLVMLCPECHKGVHRMMRRVTAPDGRRGWDSLPFTAHIWTPGEQL